MSSFKLLESGYFDQGCFDHAAFRHRTFYDVPSLQEAIKKAVKRYNDQPFQKRMGSRSSVLEEERRYLRPLLAVPYEITTLVPDLKVYPNCHISLLKSWYSVPYMWRTGILPALRICRTNSTDRKWIRSACVPGHPRSVRTPGR